MFVLICINELAKEVCPKLKLLIINYHNNQQANYDNILEH